MKTYNVTLTGVQPLLMHADNIEWADQMSAWQQGRGATTTKGKAGDDRTPAFRWIGACYHDGSELIIPMENIMKMLCQAGALVTVPGGKRGKTFQAQTQSGITPTSIGWPLLVNGEPVPWAPVEALLKEEDFAKHKERVLELGFSLFVKRVKIGQSKHVRVRPMFDRWSASGQLLVTDDAITQKILTFILEDGGRYKGLCDWRPSSKTPGTRGTFTARVTAA